MEEKEEVKEGEEEVSGVVRSDDVSVRLAKLVDVVIPSLVRREAALRDDDDAKDKDKDKDKRDFGTESKNDWNDKRRRTDFRSSSSSSTPSLPPFAHEHFVEPLSRFLFEAKLTPATWVRVPTQQVDVRVTTCDVELAATIDSFSPLDRETNAPYVTMYYDIETLGLDPHCAPVIQVRRGKEREGG